MKAIATPSGAYVVWSGGDTLDLVPGRPAPQFRDAHPVFQLWEFGDAAQLQLSVTWPAPEEWLRAHAPALFDTDELSGAATMIRVAVTGTPTLQITVAAHPGEPPTTLGAVPTSGFPPFTTVVNLSVDAVAASALRAAARGEPGRAFATVTADLPPDLPLEPNALAASALSVDLAAAGVRVSATDDLAHWAAPPPASQPNP